IGDLEDEQLFDFRVRSEVMEVGEMLRAATSVNAEIIRRPDLGVIEVGATADLVVLAGNPYQRPEVLWDPERTVIQAGTVVRP
ncbi:MAG: amidohydrolase family protein, partial [bacterium]|nr:amidohydrolase family protein [bacterium]